MSFLAKTAGSPYSSWKRKLAARKSRGILSKDQKLNTVKAKPTGFDSILGVVYTKKIGNFLRFGTEKLKAFGLRDSARHSSAGKLMDGPNFTKCKPFDSGQGRC